jgi:hypothetical protein
MDAFEFASMSLELMSYAPTGAPLGRLIKLLCLIVDVGSLAESAPGLVLPPKRGNWPRTAGKSVLSISIISPLLDPLKVRSACGPG